MGEAFRTLEKARQDYHLTLEQVFDVLVDMLHGEGNLHKEHLEAHIRDKFGDGRTWYYWSSRTVKELGYLLSQPDLPDEIRRDVQPVYEKLQKQEEDKEEVRTNVTIPIVDF